MNKKAILFDGESKKSDSGKTTSSILLLKKLIEEGYSQDEFYVHTPNKFQKYCHKNGLTPTCGKILKECTTHKYHEDFACYKLSSDFTGEQSNDTFTYHDLIKGEIDFFSLLHKDGKWVLIYSPGDYALFITFLLLVIWAILKLYPNMDTFVIVATIKDQFRENVLDVLGKVGVDNPGYVPTTAKDSCPSNIDKNAFYLPENQENVQKAFEFLRSY